MFHDKSAKGTYEELVSFLASTKSQWEGKKAAGLRNSEICVVEKRLGASNTIQNTWLQAQLPGLTTQLSNHFKRRIEITLCICDNESERSQNPYDHWTITTEFLAFHIS